MEENVFWRNQQKLDHYLLYYHNQEQTILITWINPVSYMFFCISRSNLYYFIANYLVFVPINRSFKSLNPCFTDFTLSFADKVNFVHKKWLGAKEKIKSPFSWSLLKITCFQKSHTCVGCFGLFTKLKRYMELVFTAGFLYTFSIKMFLIKYSISFNNCGSGLAA